MNTNSNNLRNSSRNSSNIDNKFSENIDMLFICFSLLNIFTIIYIILIYFLQANTKDKEATNNPYYVGFYKGYQTFFYLAIINQVINMCLVIAIIFMIVSYDMSISNSYIKIAYMIISFINLILFVLFTFGFEVNPPKKKSK